MTGRERIQTSLNHKEGPLAVDFSGTGVSGMHVSIVEKLRRHYGLDDHPVKVWEPYQMLGDVEDDLAEALCADTWRAPSRTTLFGFANRDWTEWRTPWGQDVLVSADFQVDRNDDGSVSIYPKGDRSAPPSGRLPAGGYFFDTLVRQEPIDEDKLNPEDNLQEFGLIGNEDIAHLKETVKTVAAARAAGDDRAAVYTLGGAGLGDIALVPAPFEPYPKGIRDVTEWYVSTAARPEYVREVFRRQTDITLMNLETVYATIGETPDVMMICGTDFGTQSSQFCSLDTFKDLWAPFYRKINDWIHAHTGWKTFKHSCGAVEPFIDSFIDCGFDILNPVQITATGMDPQHLKKTYGDRITFWGGGVDTQKILPFGTPDEVRDQVRRNIEIFAPGGGFVFNTIHNIQAKTPAENIAAMIEVLKEYR